jgi:Tfp pilus assembly protein PilF
VVAQLLFTQGQLGEAVNHIDIALDRSGKSGQVKQIAANLYQSYGLTLAKEKKPAEAKIYLLKALTFFPANMNYLASLIELEIAQKNIPEAQKLLDQFSTSDDVAAEHAYLQGIIRAAEDNQQGALQSYLESWNKKPMDVSAEAILGFYQKNKQKEQAEKFVDEWVSKMPKSPHPTLIKAVDAQQKNDLDVARVWYEKTVVLAPQMPTALNNLAWIYYEQKNPKAIELAKKAYELSGSNPPIMDTYGWILVENNQLDEGIGILERAANLAPDNKDIVGHLKTAKATKK